MSAIISLLVFFALIVIAWMAAMYLKKFLLKFVATDGYIYWKMLNIFKIRIISIRNIAKIKRLSSSEALDYPFALHIGYIWWGEAVLIEKNKWLLFKYIIITITSPDIATSFVHQVEEIMKYIG